MENEILRKLAEQEQKINQIYRSIEQMRKYFLWTLIITLAVIILPLIGLAIAIPKLLNTYSAIGNIGI